MPHLVYCFRDYINKHVLSQNVRHYNCILCNIYKQNNPNTVYRFANGHSFNKNTFVVPTYICYFRCMIQKFSGNRCFLINPFRRQRHNSFFVVLCQQKSMSYSCSLIPSVWLCEIGWILDQPPKVFDASRDRFHNGCENWGLAPFTGRTWPRGAHTWKRDLGWFQ